MTDHIDNKAMRELVDRMPMAEKPWTRDTGHIDATQADREAAAPLMRHFYGNHDATGADTLFERDALAKRVEALEAANQVLRNGYSDAESGLQYVLQFHGRLAGVGFDRVFDHYAEWVTIPEREGLLAGSHKIAARKALGEG